MEQKVNDAPPLQEGASRLDSNAKDKSTKSSDTIIGEAGNQPWSNNGCSGWRSRIVSDIEPPDDDILAGLMGTPIIARGNYTVITGQKKSRKSLLAAYIMGEIRGKVVIFDTEQSHRHVWMLKDRVLKLKEDRAEVTVLYLRGLSLKEKKKTIVDALEEIHDISVVMIDNIRDLLTDINNSKKSQKIIEFLEQITIKYNVGLLVTIHSNKTDGKIRGHIGSELENKSYMVIQATRRGTQSSIISCESSRDGDFESFSLRHNPETGMPEIINAELTNEKKKQILREIFAGGKLGYKELLDKVRIRFSPSGEMIPESKGKELIRVAVDKGWIVKEGKDRSPYVKYSYQG